MVHLFPSFYLQSASTIIFKVSFLQTVSSQVMFFKQFFHSLHGIFRPFSFNVIIGILGLKLPLYFCFFSVYSPWFVFLFSFFCLLVGSLNIFLEFYFDLSKVFCVHLLVKLLQWLLQVLRYIFITYHNILVLSYSLSKVQKPYLPLCPVTNVHL